MCPKYGAAISYNADEDCAKVVKGEKEMKVSLKDGAIFINGEVSDNRAVEANSRVLVPEKIIEQFFGIKSEIHDDVLILTDGSASFSDNGFDGKMLEELEKRLSNK